MRGILLVAAISAALGAALAYPFAGVLVWTWFALQNPHEESFSFAQRLPLNLIIAFVTVGAWLLSQERKAPPKQFLFWAFAIFLVWMTFNSFFAVDPTWSWPFWDRTWKTFALGFMIAVVATNPVRIHAVVWVCVLALFYYGVKGGLFTILTGGANHVFGPPRTQIHDNNQLALALLMTLPLANYLRQQSAKVWVSWAISAGMALCVVSVIGSYSRGGLIGLGALALAGILRTRRKILYLIVASLVVAAAINFMPERFLNRASTIQSAESDPSFHARTIAWQVAYHYAADHFPLGAGFYSTQLPQVYNQYFPTESTHAAHSIYFQVLGEHGFVGLLVYIIILVAAFLKCNQIIRAADGRLELEWAITLARMIRITLFVYCTAGAALSMAYYDLFVIGVALLIALAGIVGTAPVGIPARATLQPVLP